MSAAPRYIISKYVYTSKIREALRNEAVLTTELLRGLDPIFAITVGLSAAVMKVNREEKEKGRSTQQTIESLRRRAHIAWEEVAGKSAA